MLDSHIKIHRWLLPLSSLYALGVRLRNQLFDWGVLKSRSFSLPVIAVGNITVGGTGKTPHVEYLIRMLCKEHRVAVLSRGYKRATKGFILAGPHSTAREIGDEPFQMKCKYPDIHVAVDADRCHAIDLLTDTTDADVIILDDAYQHRYVKPGINILLIDCHRLITHDKMLPAGRLREPCPGKRRADVVVITKCPDHMGLEDIRDITTSLNLESRQQLFFSALEYGNLSPLFSQGTAPLSAIGSTEQVLLLTGIASPRQLADDLKPYTLHLRSICFADHHTFSAEDVEHINNTFAAMEAPKRIITTEKDAARLSSVDGLSNEVKRHLYVLPVSIKFLNGGEKAFHSLIHKYVK